MFNFFRLFTTIITSSILFVLFTKYEDSLFGIFHLYDPFSLTVLSNACRELDFYHRHQNQKPFRVNRKHDYPFEPFRERNDVTWAELAVVARSHLSRFNHSLVSSKALLSTVLGHLQSKTFLASSALPSLESVRDALRRAASDGIELLIIKAANQVQGAGQAVLHSSMPAEDALRLINETCIHVGRAFDAAFHLHSVPAGFVMQELWRKSEHHHQRNEPLLPRLARWIGGKQFRAPFEFKVVVVFGRAVIAHTLGIPGCRYVLLSDEPMYECAGSPLLTQSLWRQHAKTLVPLSEKIASATGNSWARVDWFVSQSGEFVLNEVEQIEGTFSLIPDKSKWMDVEKCMAQLWLRGGEEENNNVVVVDRTDEEVASELRNVFFF